MNADPFDTLVRRLGTPVTRRRLGLLGALGGGSLILTNEAAGKGKHKKGKHKKGKGKTSTTPAPTGAVALADASCLATGSPTSSPDRAAQTFRALRSGQLTSASFFFLTNTQGNAFDIEIWSVDQTNTPNAVLAGATIANTPAVSYTGSPQRFTATFAGPATVTVGLRYALVLTRTAGNSYSLDASGLNPCPDGDYFVALSLTDPWINTGGDLHFETVVTA